MESVCGRMPEQRDDRDRMVPRKRYSGVDIFLMAKDSNAFAQRIKSALGLGVFRIIFLIFMLSSRPLMRWQVQL